MSKYPIQFEEYPEGESDFYQGWFKSTSGWEEVIKGVRCQTFAFTDISEQEVDGAFVEVLPGYRTPVQYVKSVHQFVEVPFEGNLVFLHVNTKGIFTIRYFDGNSQRKGEHAGEVFNEVKPGELMCWYCSGDSGKQIGKIIEYETPGFNSAELPTVTPESEELEGKDVPKEFWQVIKIIDADISHGVKNFYLRSLAMVG